MSDLSNPPQPPAPLPSAPGTAPTDGTAAYPATLFRPELPNGRCEGHLTVGTDAVHFRSQDGTIDLDLPLAGLDVRVSGIHHENLHFSHPEHEGAEWITRSREIARHPQLARYGDLAAKLSQAEVRRLRGRWILPGCIAAVIVPLVLLWILKEPIIDWIVSFVPPEWEIEIGDLVFQNLEPDLILLENPELEARLDDLVAPLLEVVPDQGYAFEFHLVEDPSLNAFALPGGHILIHSGLVLAAEEPEELVGILGHEIAHVTERHTLDQMVRSAGLLAAFQFLFGDLSGVAAIAAEGGYRLIALGHSRQAELEADRVGFDYLIAARISPQGLIRVFERLQDEIASSDAAELDASLNLLSTHPMTRERQERLAEYWLETERSIRIRPSTYDLEAFQRAVNAEIEASAAAAPPDAPPVDETAPI